MQRSLGVRHGTGPRRILTSCGIRLDRLKGGRGAGQDGAAVQRGRGLQRLRVQPGRLAAGRGHGAEGVEVTAALGLRHRDAAFCKVTDTRERHLRPAPKQAATAQSKPSPAMLIECRELQRIV